MDLLRLRPVLGNRSPVERPTIIEEFVEASEHPLCKVNALNQARSPWRDEPWFRNIFPVITLSVDLRALAHGSGGEFKVVLTSGDSRSNIG